MLRQVAVLFRSHNDLLTQFTYFLPDNSPPQVGMPGSAAIVSWFQRQQQQSKTNSNGMSLTVRPRAAIAQAMKGTRKAAGLVVAQ